MPAGRPTKYKKEFCQMLIDHMCLGLSYETFGAVINVSREVLYVWEKKHEEFLHAKRLAFDRCQLFWEKQGVRGLWAAPYEANLNYGVWAFNMKNRFGWRDKVEQEINQTIDIENLEGFEQLKPKNK